MIHKILCIFLFSTCKWCIVKSRITRFIGQRVLFRGTGSRCFLLFNPETWSVTWRIDTVLNGCTWSHKTWWTECKLLCLSKWGWNPSKLWIWVLSLRCYWILIDYLYPIRFVDIMSEGQWLWKVCLSSRLFKFTDSFQIKWS